MLILSFALFAAVVASAAWAAKGSGMPLMMALVILTFGVSSVNPLIEAVVFGVMPLADAPSIVTGQLILAVVTSLIAAAALGKLRHGSQPSSPPKLRSIRLALAAFCYTVLYWTAGLFVWPFVKDYYATRTLPPVGLVLGLQLVRGALYVLYAWPWFRLTPRHSGIVLALVYSVVGGVAPLLLDNPYMPQSVRLAHMVEVGVSNFLFGLVVARLMRSDRQSLELA
jgi:hypothetical protein